MAPYETVEEYTRKRGRYVEHVRIRQTDDDAYPSGWDYALHYGTIDGETLLRYDNAHERSKGHERHEGDEVERIDFPGMSACWSASSSKSTPFRRDHGAIQRFGATHDGTHDTHRPPR